MQQRIFENLLCKTPDILLAAARAQLDVLNVNTVLFQQFLEYTVPAIGIHPFVAVLIDFFHIHQDLHDGGDKECLDHHVPITGLVAVIDIEEVTAHKKSQAIALGIDPDIAGISFVDSDGKDIGHLVAAVFAAPARFAGKTFEIASDSVTGRQLEGLFSTAAGRPIPYSRFSDEVLAASPFLHKLTGLVDDGRLAGHADLDALRQLHPQLHTFAGWLAGPGRPAFERALTSGARWAFDR